MKTAKLAASQWIVTVPAVAAAAAYVYFFFIPTQRSIAGIRGELNAADDFIAQVEAFGPAIEATRDQLETTEQYVERWHQAAPDEEGLSAVFGRISRQAKLSGITTTRFEPQPAIPYDTLRRVPVAVTCVGSFEQVCRFLRALEGLKETVWVEAVQMERFAEDGGEVQCELSLAVFADNPDDSDQVDGSE